MGPSVTTLSCTASPASGSEGSSVRQSSYMHAVAALQLARAVLLLCWWSSAFMLRETMGQRLCWAAASAGGPKTVETIECTHQWLVAELSKHIPRLCSPDVWVAGDMLVAVCWRLASALSRGRRIEHHELMNCKESRRCHHCHSAPDCWRLLELATWHSRSQQHLLLQNELLA